MNALVICMVCNYPLVVLFGLLSYSIAVFSVCTSTGTSIFFTAISLSISGPETAVITEPTEEEETNSFTVTITLSTQGGNTIGSMLEVCLEDGSGTACKFYTYNMKVTISK